MLERQKFQKRFDLSLEVGGHRISLPVRKTVAENIVHQVEHGIPFRLKDEFFAKLDTLLNYSLELEFRAPTPPQVNLMLAMMEHLDLEADELVLANKEMAGSFITSNRAAFDAVCQQTEDDD